MFFIIWSHYIWGALQDPHINVLQAQLYYIANFSLIGNFVLKFRILTICLISYTIKSCCSWTERTKTNTWCNLGLKYNQSRKGSTGADTFFSGVNCLHMIHYTHFIAHTLNCILTLLGSRWSSISTYVILSLRNSPSLSLAALFKIVCGFLSCFFGKVQYSELQ